MYGGVGCNRWYITVPRNFATITTRPTYERLTTSRESQWTKTKQLRARQPTRHNTEKVYDGNAEAKGTTLHCHWKHVLMTTNTTTLPYTAINEVT